MDKVSDSIQQIRDQVEVLQYITDRVDTLAEQTADTEQEIMEILQDVRDRLRR